MSNTNIAVLGAQWGDEGKGKIVDLLTPHFSVGRALSGRPQRRPHRLRQRQEVRAAPDPVGHPAPGVTCVIGNGVVVDPQALFKEIDELAAHRHRRRRPAAHQREGAPHPAVSPRARRAVARRGAASARSARPRAASVRPTRTRSAAAASASATCSTTAGAGRRSARERQRAQPDHQGLDARLEAGLRPAARARRADAAAGPATSRCASHQAMAAGQARAVRGRAGDAARHRPRHLSVRHLVERLDRRRLHRPRRAAARDRRRARRGQGLHDARRRRAAADRAVRRDRRAAARERAGVRRLDRAAAPLRLVRRGRRPLLGAHQRPRRASRSPSSTCSTGSTRSQICTGYRTAAAR